MSFVKNFIKHHLNEHSQLSSVAWLNLSIHHIGLKTMSYYTCLNASWVLIRYPPTRMPLCWEFVWLGARQQSKSCCCSSSSFIIFLFFWLFLLPLGITTADYWSAYIWFGIGFYAGCPSWLNPPTLSGLGTGSECNPQWPGFPAWESNPGHKHMATTRTWEVGVLRDFQDSFNCKCSCNC